MMMNYRYIPMNLSIAERPFIVYIKKTIMKLVLLHIYVIYRLSFKLSSPKINDFSKKQKAIIIIFPRTFRMRKKLSHVGSTVKNRRGGRVLSAVEINYQRRWRPGKKCHKRAFGLALATARRRCDVCLWYSNSITTARATGAC